MTKRKKWQLGRGMYLRKTERTTVNHLPKELLSTLVPHAEERELLLDNVRCWITRSENPISTNLFARLLRRTANPVDPDPWHLTLIVLHETQLLISTYGEIQGTATLSAAFASLTLSNNEDHRQLGGITITGFANPLAPGPTSVFVGLSIDPIGEECISQIKTAIAESKQQPKLPAQ